MARLRVLKSVGELDPDVGGVSSLSQLFSLDPRRSICVSVSAISGPVFAVGREVAAGLSGFSTGSLVGPCRVWVVRSLLGLVVGRPPLKSASQLSCQGPVLGQVDNQSLRGPGEPAWDGDQLPADRRALALA